MSLPRSIRIEKCPASKVSLESWNCAVFVYCLHDNDVIGFLVLISINWLRIISLEICTVQVYGWHFSYNRYFDMICVWVVLVGWFVVVTSVRSISVSLIYSGLVEWRDCRPSGRTFATQLSCPPSSSGHQTRDPCLTGRFCYAEAIAFFKSKKS